MRPATVSRLTMAAAALMCLLLAFHPPAAEAASYTKISGAGSTWSSNALDQWRRNVASNSGMTVNYAALGSSVGREQFKNGTADFAVSEIPYGLTEGGARDAPPKRGYAYMPIVAGGTAFMYNLRIGGKKVTNLRLSGEVVTKIFTGKISMWNAQEIRADNPGLDLPARRVVPVVRSDGSGTTAQLTTWMAKEHGGLWNDYCRRAGRSTPCGMTSYFPLVPGSSHIAKSGSLGVSGFTKQGHAEGAITYVEYSYATTTGFPVAKLLNAAGYYVEPTASSVAVALLKARINEDRNSENYLTQILDGVYRSSDRRTYTLSSYSYMVVPTKAEQPFTTAKGRTLGTFANYFLCDGQQQAEELGYSPLPKNLVEAGFAQVRRIPGAPTGSIDITKCRNPTFSSDGSNTLAKNAPYPKACDKRGPTQCSDGTAGAKEETPVKPAASGGGSGGANGGGGAGDGGGTASGGATGGAATAGSAGSSTGGATGAGGAAGDTAGSATGGGVVDPDTGELIGVGGAGDTSVAANPVTLAAGESGGLRGALMALSAVLLIGVVVGPPLTARALAARGRRKEGSR
ncbi:phosphate ABC transporter substrate-binding protein PstS [Streptomyces sp. NBC_01498]|uniref:phosphate ABC transporter substrate-binding protein PstS n=1 Tax=Streptomyces sp. NBC_01498 TaxID=2975870 RepID=UPI002E7C5215|nr:phosphate ABC transporter substrate-binding protein PstS [Streptomyces sp. NBC_01498]WTL26848.1 phosphate ABC transporter substrate-binding protein PstS [Streptomyces sp. NBC_01498]